jgi:hypothetical protein
MIEYTFKKAEFIKGIIDNSKLFLIILFFVFWVAAILTRNFIGVLIFDAVLCFFIVITIWRRSIYFIQHILIDERGVSLVVYKYDKVYIDELFGFEDVSFDVQIAAASVRGVTLKMLVNIKGQVISQYALNGWEDEYFQNILNCKLIRKTPKRK